MPLIEIVQLVLVGFILISLLIFGVAYIGYRKKAWKSTLNTKQKLNPKDTKSNVKSLNKTEEKSTNPKYENPVLINSDVQKEDIQNIKSTTKQTRFEVFKPEKDNAHFPKTLTINITKDKLKGNN